MKVEQFAFVDYFPCISMFKKVHEEGWYADTVKKQTKHGRMRHQLILFVTYASLPQFCNSIKRCNFGTAFYQTPAAGFALSLSFQKCSSNSLCCILERDSMFQQSSLERRTRIFWIPRCGRGKDRHKVQTVEMPDNDRDNFYT